MRFEEANFFRWRRRFALIPVTVGGTWDQRKELWLEWYEWRWIKENGSTWQLSFERRAMGATETYVETRSMDYL